jgi:hypothetical protein
MVGCGFSAPVRQRFVLINQPVEDLSLSDSLGGEAGWRRLGWPAVQGAVRAVLVVVGKVLGEHLSLVSFAVDEQVVGASRRRVPIQRSQIAFARGAWIGVFTIWMPSEVKTVSKLAVYLASGRGGGSERMPGGA